jgi:hypothetical protein
MLDLFCGRWGWSKVFATRGWECAGVDISAPLEEPEDCDFIEADVLNIWFEDDSFHIPELGGFVRYIPRPDFICASPPCEQFSVHGMKHFHPNPPYPELGLKLFNHTREICEASGVPYVIENVRAAQQFVGNAVHHCGPFYLWGNAVPPLMHKGIIKGWGRKWIDSQGRVRDQGPTNRTQTAQVATIPPELANCVADYAERICEKNHEECNR